MGGVAADAARDVDKLCEKTASIEVPIQGAMLIRRVRAVKEWVVTAPHLWRRLLPRGYGQ